MKRARGLTMAELLVALALGLLVLGVAGSLLVVASRSHAEQLDAAGIDDGGRFALEAIERAARQAGFVHHDGEPIGAVDPAAPARVSGLDNHFVSRAGNGIELALDGAVNGSDVLALRFGGAGKGAHGDGSITSCGGFGVGEGDEGWSIFYVARGGSGEAELRCKYRGKNSWGADAIVSGVDTFQVLYGVDTGTAAEPATTYVNASALQAQDAALAAAGAGRMGSRTGWNRINSIKVALLLHGERPTRTAAAPATIDAFGSAYADAHGADDTGTRLREADLPPSLRARERRLFAATIALRNPGY